MTSSVRLTARRFGSLPQLAPEPTYYANPAYDLLPPAFSWSRMSAMGQLLKRAFGTSAIVIGASLLGSTLARSEVSITTEHNENGRTSPSFAFKNVPAPARSGPAIRPGFALIDGEPDPNGGGLELLTDGLLPQEADAPSENFFFKPGTDGGRLLVDLGHPTELTAVNTYSWHPGTRGPQLYTLYAMHHLGSSPSERPKKGTDPAAVGWKLLAKVDTRPKQTDVGGQYGVHISDTNGRLGIFRYLLFDISQTENADPFGNTFYSEIEVVGLTDSKTDRTDNRPACREIIETGDGAYRITVDSCDTPDLTDWCKTELSPVVRDWYPRLVKLLPSDGFDAPKDVSVRFSASLRGVAETSGTRVRCAAQWFRANLKGEAAGSVVHELVHVVQQYGNARRNNPDATPSPGWLVEGIADYVRWFLYEPQSHGADLVWMRQRKNLRLRHDAGYRVTANFLNWVTAKYDSALVQSLNAAMRQGTYREDLWKALTGRTLLDLGSEWKKEVEFQLAPGDAPKT